MDHVVLYNAGSGECAIVKGGPGGFQIVYYTEDQGLGDWDFKGGYDKAIALDFDHSGKQDHILCYRPGAGGVLILKNRGGGQFDTVYSMPPAAAATAAEER